MDKVDEIEKLLHNKKNNRETLLQRRALTDTSYKNINHELRNDGTNFELATYGDALLKCALCQIYCEKEHNEDFGFKGKLTEWKKQYESDKALVKFIARRYDILNFLDFDKEDKNKPHDYEYVAADKIDSGKSKDKKSANESTKKRYKYIATAIEACIAAVYMEAEAENDKGGKGEEDKRKERKGGKEVVLDIVAEWVLWIDDAVKAFNAADLPAK